MARWRINKIEQLSSALLGAVMLVVICVVGAIRLSSGQAASVDVDMTYSVEMPAQEVDTSFHVEVIRATVAPPLAGKSVLIYHTHTWEAFEQEPGALYEETEKWRSKDSTVNMLAVGNALTMALEAQGCTVVHDETAFEPPDLSTAYQRSLAMLERRLQAGETYDLYIDLHRDAIASQSTIKRTVNIAGEEVARFMVLVGKGQGYAEKPDWEANYVIAEKLTASLNRQAEGLCRDIKLKTGRFNQHIAPRCVLIECGLNYNTLDEVLRGVPYLAEAIMSVLNE